MVEGSRRWTRVGHGHYREYVTSLIGTDAGQLGDLDEWHVWLSGLARKFVGVVPGGGDDGGLGVAARCC
jgi:hypothetical protein